jgi:hypothetical protein
MYHISNQTNATKAYFRYHFSPLKLAKIVIKLIQNGSKDEVDSPLEHLQKCIDVGVFYKLLRNT